MSAYTSISIIFNPNSTGNGEQLAAELRDALTKKGSKVPIKLVATKHAGHAETLAYDLAIATKRPLIISASGDGGYHEVINGIMKAHQEGTHAVAGLLPAGNANDHFNTVHDSDIANSILEHKQQHIDVLTLKTTKDGQPLTRYAHSYIGIGLTPKVGKELNKTELNWWNEIIIVLRVLFFLRPTRISIAGKTRSYDSVIFSNIDRMAKVLTLSKEASTDDGKFEMTAFRRRSKFKLIRTLIRSSTLGSAGDEQLSEYTFKTVKPLLVQLDGEVTTMDAHTDVEIGIEHRALTCLA